MKNDLVKNDLLPLNYTWHLASLLPFTGSAALGFYTIIGSTPVYAVGMYHLPGTDNYLTIAT